MRVLHNKSNKRTQKHSSNVWNSRMGKRGDRKRGVWAQLQEHAWPPCSTCHPYKLQDFLTIFHSSDHVLYLNLDNSKLKVFLPVCCQFQVNFMLKGLHKFATFFWTWFWYLFPPAPPRRFPCCIHSYFSLVFVNWQIRVTRVIWVGLLKNVTKTLERGGFPYLA